jgi:uncharacterized membrane protein
MDNIKKVILLAIAVAFVAGGYFYPSMPELMASHWDGNGQVNGYMPKFWALFLMPIMTLAIVGLFILLPKIDPLKANYKKFAKYYDRFLAVFVAFMVYLYALTILFNRGMEFNMTVALIPALAALFYFIGTVLENTKQNWFIGIRTPWTLSSEKVWDKTNKLGAKFFKIFALLSLALVFLGDLGLMLLVVLIIIPSFYLILYSYLEFRKEGK